MRSVFISYRRDDAGGHAGRLSDRLVARFGDPRVFVDVQDIRPGQNFEQAIESTLAQCDHLLAIIGPRWVQALEARRAGEDFVRREVAVAVSRGLTVIPVLVGGARMPAVADLPPDLAAFARCQAVEIRDTHFDEDAASLVRFLAGGRDDTIAIGRVRVRRRVAAGVAAALAVVVAGVWFMRGASPPEGSTGPDAATLAPVVTPAPGDVPSGDPAAAANAGIPATAAAPDSAVRPATTSPAASAPAAVPAPVPVPALDGDWLAEMRNDRQQAYRIRLTLARVGRVLTGMVRYPTGDAGILDGQIDGDTFSFRTRHVPQFESEPATIQVAGTIDGDRLRLVVTSESGSNTGVAARVAPPAPR